MHARALLRVVRASLMRVLAVAKVHDLREGGDEGFREGLDITEPAGDRSFVRGGRRECLRRQRSSCLAGEVALLPQLGEHRLVPLRPTYRGDMGEVLRGAAQHRRPADVDHLDSLLLPDAVTAGDLAERIEVDADERSEEHTSELQSHVNLVCRLLLEKKK